MRKLTHPTALAIIALCLIATSCFPNENNPDDGSITFRNNSDQTIVILTGFRPDLQVVLDVNQPRSLGPSGWFSRGYGFSSDPDAPRFCAQKTWIAWILQTTKEGSRNADDYEILDQMGPNHCFDQRNVEYIYPP